MKMTSTANLSETVARLVELCGFATLITVRYDNTIEKELSWARPADRDAMRAFLSEHGSGIVDELPADMEDRQHFVDCLTSNDLHYVAFLKF